MPVTPSIAVSESCPLEPISAPAVLRLMGNFSLVIGGEERSSRLTYEKVRLMLAVLALSHAQPVSRAKLARMIWPDVDVSEGRARVRHALHTLRQVFNTLPEALEVDATRIRLCVDLVQVDVLSLVEDPSTPFRVDDAQRLEWYQPPLLDNINAPSTEEFQSWLQGWQARIEIEMAQWRQRVIERHIQDNQVQVALVHASRWVDRWPEDESCHRALIRLLVETGQQDAAVLAFEHCSRVLSDRLGLDPSAETRALLGIEAPVASVVPTRPRFYGREYRPLAVLAVTLTWPTSHRDAESAVESLELARRDVLTAMQAKGAWAVQAVGGFLLAYFGYPNVTERPIDSAITLARAISDMPLQENIRLGMGLHADVALIESESNTPDAAALLSQSALSLSWQARHRETLLSQSAVHRLPWHQLLVLKRGGAADYVLQYSPQPEVTPRLYGRSREFDFLVGQWTRLLFGRPPAVVYITGFPGIGKSLLASAVAEYAVQSGGQRFVVTCVEGAENKPLHPLLNWLRQQRDVIAASLRDMDNDAIIERLCDMLGVRHQQAATVESLLSTAPLSDALVAEAEDLFAAILARHTVDAQQPRLIVFENLQWSDPVTLALIQQIQQRPTRMPLMMLGISRTPVPQEYGTALRLEPLGERDIAQFVAQRSRTQKLSRKQRQHVLEHCQGVPLHALLLMRQTTQDLPLELSSGLTDTLCVEMRRLQPAELEVAQLTALMDASLHADDVGAVLAMPEQVVQEAMDCLVSNGMLMICAEGAIDCPTLIRLALKRMTPRKTRQRLHTLIARHLINGDAAPAKIALHVEAADEPSTPIWWQRAAVHEVRQHQPRRARANLERALKHAHRIDTSEARRNFEFECQVLLGELAAATSGPGAEQTLLAYEAANRKMPADNPYATLVAIWGSWVGCQHTARYTEALDFARRHMRLAIELENEQAKGWSHYAMGQTHLWCGQLVEAEHQLEQSMALLANEPSQDDPPTGYGRHGVALVHGTQALCLALQGRVVQALTLSRHATQMAMMGGEPMTTVGCLLLSARVHYVVGDVQAASLVCQSLLSHMPPNDASSPWYALMHAYAALPEVLEGTNSDALQTMRDALPAIEAGMPTLMNSTLCLIARGLIAKHEFDDAAAVLAQAEEINRRQHSFTVEPEIYCLRGDMWQASGQLLRAHKSWHQGRASAIRHGLLAYVAWVDSRLAEYPATSMA